MSLKETGWADVNWIQLAHSRDKWQVSATKGMNISFLQLLSFCISERRIEIPRKTLFLLRNEGTVTSVCLGH
jgi:hypothetical protein